MLRVLTRVLAVQMGKEGRISEMLCRKNLQAAESELGCEPGGGTHRSCCPGDSMERQYGAMDGGMGGGMEGWVVVWVEGWGCAELSEMGNDKREIQKMGSCVLTLLCASRWLVHTKVRVFRFWYEQETDF